jgi:hypothetical protein
MREGTVLVATNEDGAGGHYYTIEVVEPGPEGTRVVVGRSVTPGAARVFRDLAEDILYRLGLGPGIRFLLGRD